VMHANRLSCRFVLRFSLLTRVFEGPSLALRKRATSLPLPYRAYFAKSSDARGGITGEKITP
jgi:hypothetical protein